MSGLLGQLGLAALMKGMGGGGGRRRYSRAPAKKYRRTIKRLRSSAPYRMSRMYPASKYGYSAVPRTAETLQNYGETYRKATDAQKLQRKTDRYFGRGLYMGQGAYNKVNRLKKAGRWAGFAGDMLQKGMTMYTGMGEYAANSTLSDGMDTKPTFANMEDELGAIVISHNEYLTDIYGNADYDGVPFVNTSWPLNPGLERTFPWLSQLAANFEEFEFKQLLFQFRSTIASETTTSNGQVGQIIMTTNYNANQPKFVDKSSMMQYAGSVSSKVVDSIVHGVECDPEKLSGTVGKYVRTSPVQVGEDVKSYDAGLFQVAVVGTPESFQSQIIGELWVTYTIVLRKPKLYSGIGSSISTDLWCFTPWAATTALNTNTNFLRGQQNCCDTLVEYNAVARVQITWPAYASSYYEVDCVMKAPTAWTTVAATWGLISSSGNVQMLNGFPKAGAFGTSSTSLIGDSTIINGTAQDLSIVTYKVRFKVGQAPSGVNNRIVLQVPNGTGMKSQSVYMINITEINTLPGGAGGNNLVPILVDRNGESRTLVASFTDA